MSLCAARMERWFDKRWKEDGDTPSAISFGFVLDLCSKSWFFSKSFSFMRPCDIYGQEPTAKANIMSFHSAIHIVLPRHACGEE